MAVKDIVAAVADPLFYERVAYIALRAAQNVAAEPSNTANHANRVHYANLIFTGKDTARLLASHLVSSNGTISAALSSGVGGETVPDSDIEYAMGGIWDARANAFANV